MKDIVPETVQIHAQEIAMVVLELVQVDVQVHVEAVVLMAAPVVAPSQLEWVDKSI